MQAYGLLLVARLDAGKLEVSDKPFDLATVLREGAERFEVNVAGKGIRLDARAPDELPAHGDLIRAAQILAVLIGNAMRYTPAGGRIVVEGRLRDGRTESSVADTGPRVVPAQVPRIFDRFYRAEAARTRGGGGTGLGLAIARDLAHAQGGDLVAANGEGGERYSPYACHSSEAVYQGTGTGRQPVCPFPEFVGVS